MVERICPRGGWAWISRKAPEHFRQNFRSRGVDRIHTDQHTPITHLEAITGVLSLIAYICIKTDNKALNRRYLNEEVTKAWADERARKYQRSDYRPIN